MHRIVEVRRLDHVVLLVAAQAVLRTECGGELHLRQLGERVERVLEAARQRSRMGEQRDALALERLAELGLLDQAVNAESHGSSSANALAW